MQRPSHSIEGGAQTQTRGVPVSHLDIDGGIYAVTCAITRSIVASLARDARVLRVARVARSAAPSASWGASCATSAARVQIIASRRSAIASRPVSRRSASRVGHRRASRSGMTRSGRPGVELRSPTPAQAQDQQAPSKDGTSLWPGHPRRARPVREHKEARDLPDSRPGHNWPPFEWRPFEGRISASGRSPLNATTLDG